MVSTDVDQRSFPFIQQQIDQLKHTINNIGSDYAGNEGLATVDRHIQIDETKKKLLHRLLDVTNMVKEHQQLVEDMEKIAKNYTQLQEDGHNRLLITEDTRESTEHDLAEGGENGNLLAVEGTSYDSFSPQLCVQKPIRLQPKLFAFDINHVDEQEFEDVPKYMRGRLIRENLNAFIDRMNRAIANKYELLSKCRSSMKMHEKTLYAILKRQQNAFKGKRFVSEADIAREMDNKVLDKKAFNFLTILRHVKRIRSDRFDGCVLYFLLGEV